MSALSLAHAFAAIDTDADGLVSVDDIRRVGQWSADVARAGGSVQNLESAFTSAVRAAGSEKLSSQHFEGHFMRLLGSLHGRVHTAAGRNAFTTAIVRCNFSLLFESLRPRSGTVTRCRVIDLFDHAKTEAMAKGQVVIAAKASDVLGTGGGDQAAVGHDRFVDAAVDYVRQGVSIHVIMEAGLASQSRSASGNPAGGSSSVDDDTASSASAASSTVGSDGKIMRPSEVRAREKQRRSTIVGGSGGGDTGKATLPDSPLRRRGASIVGGDGRSGSPGTTLAAERAERTRLEGRCRQLQAQVADQEREIERLRRLTNLSGPGSPTAGSAGRGGGGNVERAAQQAEIADLKNQVATLNAKAAEQKATFDRELKTLRDEHRKLSEDVSAAHGRRAVLERYATQHESWISLVNSFKNELRGLVHDQFEAFRELQAQEVEGRVAVAERTLRECRRAASAAKQRAEDADAAMASVKAAEDDVSMREAMLVVRETKFEALQKRAETVALPERERRLQALQRIEGDVHDQLVSVRRAQEALAVRELDIAAENEALREQVALLSKALLDARREHVSSRSATPAGHSHQHGSPSHPGVGGRSPSSSGGARYSDHNHHRHQVMSRDEALSFVSPSPPAAANYHHHQASPSPSRGRSVMSHSHQQQDMNLTPPRPDVVYAAVAAQAVAEALREKAASSPYSPATATVAAAASPDVAPAGLSSSPPPQQPLHDGDGSHQLQQSSPRRFYW